jgi:hypothetical protein
LLSHRRYVRASHRQARAPSVRSVGPIETAGRAQAQLDVRLEHLTTIVDRVMSTIDRNPQLLENLVQRLGSTVDELGSNAARAIRGDLPSRSAEPEHGLQPGDEPVD